MPLWEARGWQTPALGDWARYYTMALPLPGEKVQGDLTRCCTGGHLGEAAERPGRRLREAPGPGLGHSPTPRPALVARVWWFRAGTQSRTGTILH